MSKKKLPSINHRVWLNNKEGSAYVYLHGRVDDGYGVYEDDRTAYITLEIKDCNRQCQLEFWYDNKAEYKERLAKLKRLRDEIDALEKFMLDNPPIRAPRKKKTKLKKTVLELSDGSKLHSWEEDTEEELQVTTEGINDAQDASKGRVIDAAATMTPVSRNKAK